MERAVIRHYCAVKQTGSLGSSHKITQTHHSPVVEKNRILIRTHLPFHVAAIEIVVHRKKQKRKQ